MAEIMFLREFVDLADTCSFQDTSENMNISASALSKHIHKLEEEFGVPLFDRTTRNVKLSTYGIIVRKYADQIIKIDDQCISEISDAKTSEDLKLNVGYIPMLARYDILDTLSTFSKLHPEISLKISESFRLSESLQEGKMDVIFVDGRSASKTPNAHSIQFLTDHMVVVLAPNHPLASREYVTIEDLIHDNKFLMHCTTDGKLTRTSQIFLKECQNRGYTVNYDFTTCYTSTLLRMVESGQGICIMNSAELRGNNDFGCVSVDILPKIELTCVAQYLNNQNHTKAKSELIRYLKSMNCEEKQARDTA